MTATFNERQSQGDHHLATGVRLPQNSSTDNLSAVCRTFQFYLTKHLAPLFMEAFFVVVALPNFYFWFSAAYDRERNLFPTNSQ